MYYIDCAKITPFLLALVLLMFVFAAEKAFSSLIVVGWKPVDALKGRLLIANPLLSVCVRRAQKNSAPDRRVAGHNFSETQPRRRMLILRVHIRSGSPMYGAIAVLPTIGFNSMNFSVTMSGRAPSHPRGQRRGRATSLTI